MTDHHLDQQNLHVSLSDRVLDVYENQFIGHQVPKKWKLKDRESTFIQFSRSSKSGEAANAKGDSFFLELDFDLESIRQWDFDHITECVSSADYYFMKAKDDSKEKDYTKCMLHQAYKEPIDWEEISMPPLSMPQTRACANPGASPRIYGGQETGKGRYPWFAWSMKPEVHEVENCGLT